MSRAGICLRERDSRRLTSGRRCPAGPAASSSFFSGFAGGLVRARRTVSGLLALVLLLGAAPAWAQTAQTPPCSENSGLVSGVECIEPSNSDNDIDIRRDKATIGTSGGTDHGVHGWKKGGTGDIDIDVTRSTVSTTGGGSEGVRGQHEGAGSIDIDVRDSTVTTLDGHGIYGSDFIGGNDVAIYIYIRNSDITTN